MIIVKKTEKPAMQNCIELLSWKDMDIINLDWGNTFTIDTYYTNPHHSKEQLVNGIKKLYSDVILGSFSIPPIQHKNWYLLNIAIKKYLWEVLTRWDEWTKESIYNRNDYIHIFDDTTYTTTANNLQNNNNEDITNYKHRALTGFWVIELYSITPAEIEENKEYLKEYNENKYIAYYLGTLIHEIAHNIDQEYLETYTLLCNEDITINITNYVKKHKEMYNTNEQWIIREDFAEWLRLYTTNYEYLKKKSPQRAEFFDTYLAESFEKNWLRSII